jgi:glutathione synthase/RimK-type ligase-like ATP-grasp enzyme
MKIGSTGKYTKYKLLAVDGLLRSSMPETKIFTKQNFIEMLNRHRSIIIKPSLGFRGYNVLKITAINSRFILHSSNTEEIFKELSLLFDRLKIITQKRIFIVQEYIPLAQINGRPFDVRAIVQRKVNSEWEVTGIYAKIAEEGAFITNLRTNASVMEVKQAINLSNITKEKSPEDIISQIYIFLK